MNPRLSDLDAAATERVMKRSRGFSNSFSLEEDPQLLSSDEDTEEEQEKTVTELEKPPDPSLGAAQVPRSNVLRPQDLWLAVSQCLTLHWPPCLSRNRTSKNLVAQSASKQPSANDSPSRALASRDRSAMRKEEDVPSKVAKTSPSPIRGLSRSLPRLPSTRPASDLASVLSEKDTFLRIELVDASQEGEDSRYRAEWKLSETTKDVAEGIWFSRNKTRVD